MTIDSFGPGGALIGHLDSTLLTRTARERRARLATRRSAKPFAPLDCLEPRQFMAGDGIAPVVQLINRLDNSGLINNLRVDDYDVLFSEPVTGVDVNSFVVIATGTATGTVQSFVPITSSLYRVNIASISGEGTLNIQINDNNSIVDLDGNPLGFTLSSQTTFAAETSVDAAIVDINGDGNFDAVMGDIDGNHLSVLLGNGDGTFKDRTTYDVPFPSNVLVADFNSDGKADIVAGSINYFESTTTKTASILFGNGDGTFQPAVSFNTGFTAPTLALADINGDKQPDLVLSTSSSVGVMLGNPNGTFAPAITTAASASIFAAVVDLNHDQILDVALAQSNAGTMGVLLGNGDGTFQPQTTYAVGTAPSSVAMGDINGDDNLDALVANRTAGTLSLMLGNGDGTFQPQTTIALNKGVFMYATFADMNKDGNLDIVESAVAAAIGTNVLLGNGDGTFQPQITFSGNTGRFNLPVDINKDGKLDLILAGGVASGALGVMLQPSGPAYTVDTKVPTVASIVQNETGPNSGALVTYTATFSEAVTGVEASDFVVARTGTAFGVVKSVVNVSPSVYRVTIGSISGDGTLNLQVGGANSIRDLAFNPLGVTFAPQTTYVVGQSAAGLAVADVNGDGILDAVLTNRTEGVAVLLGNGDGTYQPKRTFAAPAPSNVAIADLNGDSALDIVVGSLNLVGSTTTQTASVLFGIGDGTFAPRVSFDTGIVSLQIRLAHMDGDQNLDLVMVDGGSKLGVMLGNGNGTFQPTTTFSAPSSAVFEAIGDVNHDNNLDVLVAGSSNTLGVLLGNGDGTFASQATYGTGKTANSVALGDVNGDGNVDALVANRGATSVSLLLGNGNGTFQPQVTFAAGKSGVPTSMATFADMNGDGKLDIVELSFSGTGLNVLLGNGDGTFQAQTSFATTVGEFAVVTDVNADGKPDVLVAGSNAGALGVSLQPSGASYLVDVTSPRVSAIERFSPGATATSGEPAYFVVTFTEPVTGVDPSDFALSLNGVTASISDVTIASENSFVVTVSSVTGAGTVGVNLVDNGTIHDLTGNPLTGNGPSFFSPPTFIQAPSNGWTFSDVNADGKQDLILSYASGALGVMLGNGDGTFQAQTTVQTVGSSRHIAVADFDADGHVDLAVSNFSDFGVSVMFGNGDGTFASGVTFAVGDGPVSVQAADVNGDGKPDLIAPSVHDNILSVLLGDGGRSFSSALTFAVGADARAFVLGDFNHDGRPDIAVANRADSSVSVLLGVAIGVFAPQTTLTSDSGVTAIQVGDFNGDGNPDLVVSGDNASGVSVMLGVGDGTFTAISQVDSQKSSGFEVADINGDGRLDLVTMSPNLGVMLGNGDGTFGTRTLIPPATPNFNLGAAVADVNGDGRPDIASFEYNQSSIAIRLGANPGDFTGQAYTIVLPVNAAPSFTKGPDITTSEDAGAQSIAWATAISPGPATDANQAVNFIVNNNNNAFFTTQPAIAADGKLSFTAAPNVSGVAVVTVQLHDSGGTANGGVDTSATQTFTINIAAVNDAPTFTKGPDIVVAKGSGAYSSQTAWATSVSAGPADEATQAPTFTLSGFNPAFFSVQPTINSAGVLTFTPAPTAFGAVSITATLQDTGGTTNGGIDSSSQTFTVTTSLEFGTVNGKKNVKITATEADGTNGTFSITGNGKGTLLPRVEGSFDVTIVDANNKSTLKVAADKLGGGTFNLHNITVNDATSKESLAKIDAKTTNLAGNLTVTGTIASVALGNVTGPAAFTIGAAAKPADKVAITLGKVTNLAINSSTPIASLSMIDWSDTNAADVVTAPWIGTLNVVGSKTDATLGDFEANLNLTGVSAPKGVTLAKFTAKKDLASSNWNIVGNVGAVSVGGAIGNSQLRVTGNAGAVTAASMTDSLLFAGVANNVAGLPASLADFSAASTIASLTLKGTASASFVRSMVAAKVLTKISLKAVEPGNGGTTFGFAADKIAQYSRQGLAVTLKKLDAANANNDAAVGGDFVLRTL